MSRSFKFFIGFIVYSATIAVVLGAASLWWMAKEFKKPGPLETVATIEIPGGSSVLDIAQILDDAGAVDTLHQYIFILGTRILGTQSKMQAGEYEIEAHTSPRDIMIKLRDGDVINRRITIREGLTSYEIVEILKGVPDLSGDPGDIPPEGSLLPDTYDYRKGETREHVLKRMQQAMRSEIFLKCGYLHEALDWDSIDKMTFARYADSPCPEDTQKKHFDGMNPVILNVLTMASIVEKETGVASERKRVAGVFINRLKRGIALQTDPTVIYGITKGKHENDGLGPLGRRLLRKDLETDTPYNTYKHPGLPPGPICNPGRESIEAVLQPEEHNFIYFVADGTGGHVFSETLTEHNKKVAEWQKIRKEKEKKN